MKTGKLIRKYRKMRGMTQAELAEKCGLSDSAVRNYELGNRTPGKDHLENMAEALGIAQEALIEVEMDSVRKALEYLFRIDEEFGLKPERDGEGAVVLAIDPRSPKSLKLAVALKAWLGQQERLELGELSQDEYDAWKASLGISNL